MTHLKDDTTIPRRCVASEIKLLRLNLFSHSKSTYEDIGGEWTHAQPAENLSPKKAAAFLGVEIWAPQSVVKKRYKTLQLRYPQEQFIDKHIEWRPSFELLSIPRKRLNWFWQSGFVPFPSSQQDYVKGSIWDKESTEPAITSREVLLRLSFKK